MIQINIITTMQWVKGNVIPASTDPFAYIAIAKNLDGRKVVEIDYLDNFNYKRNKDNNECFTLLDSGIEGWAILNIPYPFSEEEDFDE